MKNIPFAIAFLLLFASSAIVVAQDDVYDAPRPRKEKVKMQQSDESSPSNYEKTVPYYDEDNSNIATDNSQRKSYNNDYNDQDDYAMTYSERIQRFHNPELRFYSSWNNCINNWYDPYYSYTTTMWNSYSSFTPNWWMPSTQIVIMFPSYSSWWTNTWYNPYSSWSNWNYGWGNNWNTGYWGSSWGNNWGWNSPVCNNYGWGNNYYNNYNHYGYSGYNNNWYDNNNYQNPRNTTYTPRHTTFGNSNNPHLINTSSSQNPNGYTQPNTNTNTNSYSKPPTKQWNTPKNPNTGKPDVYQNSPNNNTNNNSNWNTTPNRTNTNNNSNNNGWNNNSNNNSNNNTNNNSGVKTGSRPK